MTPFRDALPPAFIRGLIATVVLVLVVGVFWRFL